MIVSARTGSRCIRCVYRAHLRGLQQKRCNSTTPEDWQPSPEKANLFRKTGGPRKSEYDGGLSIGRMSQDNGEKEYSWPDPPRIARNRTDPLSGKGRYGRKEGFMAVLPHVLSKVREEVKDAPVLNQVAKDTQEWDGKSARDLSFNKLWKSFTTKIMSGATSDGISLGRDQTLYEDLSNVFRERGRHGLDDRVKYAFYGHVTGSRFTSSDIRNQQTMTDLRYPNEWFPATRMMHRTIHLHVGPTNSGKTYHALQRLEQAKTGTYAGPLRLLAHEVFTRLNAKGKPCALVTGEERRLPPGSQPDEPIEGAFNMTACTVEMMQLNKPLDVAVIDEIQMIGNAERGWAWTQGLLGVMAREVHLCGEERTVPLIKELCASVGEKLEIHRYQRLSPLAVSDSSLDGDLRKLRKGDCIVSFSVMGIHALRKQVEKSTGRKVATVYGSLPPETRAQQARLFNDPDNDYDYLVASDAVGMGLNLAIRRIIFESSSKFNGVSRQRLSIADIKQIGGRAGRFRIAEQGKIGAASAEELAAAKGEAAVHDSDMDASHEESQNLGLVTTLERFDFPVVRAAMSAEPEPIKSAGLFPPAAILERFAGYFPPGTPFSYILTRLHELSQIHSRFHLCGLRDQVWIADIIEGVEGLSVSDRNILCSSPAGKADLDLWKQLMPAYARCISTQSGGNILDIKELPLEIMEAEIQGTREYLRELERLHKGIVVYLWLSYRFAGIFSTRSLAFHVKGLVEERIEKTLSHFSFSEAQRRKIAALREKQMLQSLVQESEDQSDKMEVKAQSTRTDQLGETEYPAADGAEEESLHRRRVVSAEQVDDDNFDFGAQLDGLAEQPIALQPRQLDEQSSQLAGGDHFGGSTEDIELEEPGLEPDGIDEDARTPSEEAADTSEQAEQPAVDKSQQKSSSASV